MRQYWRWMVGGVIVFVLAFVDVSLIAAKQHTKTVTHTKIVTKQVTRTVTKNARFDGSPTSLAMFLRPTQAHRQKCPAGFPAGAACYVMGGKKFYVFLAVPTAQ